MNPPCVAYSRQRDGRRIIQLIVHISCIEQLPPLVREIPDLALKIAEKYWPGPLTMIFPKSDLIPSATSGGLDTVAVRMPQSPAARAIIDACGFPLAAPSANLSGSPSPTTAQHVMNDMNGRIPLIIDGGECSCGVESTVLCFPSPDRVRILRPGGVTAEMLSELCAVDIDPAVTSEPPKGAKVMSPGMKYKHYSPRAEVYIVNAHGDRFRDWCLAHSAEGTLALSADSHEHGMFRCFGSNVQEQAHRLLRFCVKLMRRVLRKCTLKCHRRTESGWLSITGSSGRRLSG